MKTSSSIKIDIDLTCCGSRRPTCVGQFRVSLRLWPDATAALRCFAIGVAVAACLEGLVVGRRDEAPGLRQQRKQIVHRCMSRPLRRTQSGSSQGSLPPCLRAVIEPAHEMVSRTRISNCMSILICTKEAAPYEIIADSLNSCLRPTR